jgi:hypothetical protein
MKKVLAYLILLGAFMAGQDCFGASPALGILVPRGAQRGRKLELRLFGQRLKDAQQLISYNSKIKVLKLRVINDKQVRVNIHILPDCPLGEAAFRLRCASGLTELRTFWVGALRDINEKEPNNDDVRAQVIPLNVTVQGVIKNEDVDRFRFTAKKGQRVTADVLGMRLGTTMFDPALSIIDSRGFIIAQSDDTAMSFQDAICSTKIPADGQYIVEVRESAYRGNNNSHYRLNLGTFPRPLAVMPPGGKAGSKLRVHFLGDVAGITSAVVTVPTSGSFYPLRLKDKQGLSTTAIPFRISKLNSVGETQPNDHYNQTPKFKSHAAPIAFYGCIDSSNDGDWFRFSGKKGQRFELTVYSRRIGSPLDPVLSIHDGRNGKYIAGNDDKGGPDSSFAYTLNRTGDFMVHIRDHLRRGGPEFVYWIEVKAPEPSFALSIPKFARYGQTRQDLSVPRGNRVATLINAGRVNFRGPLKIEARSLPKGVKAHIPVMHQNVARIPVVFEAALSVKPQSALIDFFGRLNDKRKLDGWLQQPSELVYGPPNNRLYWQRIERKTALVVTNPVPFSIEIVAPKVPMVQDGAMGLVVIAKRQKGYKAAIRVEMLINPPGVGSGRSATIPAKADRTRIPMNANNKSQPGRWPIVVVARARVGNGDIWVSSQLVMLEIARPMVKLSFRRSAVEQGKETEIVCTVKINKALEAPARARLIGLPRGVSASELILKPGMKEMVFAVKTAKNSRPGRYRNIYGQVICSTKNGEILHRTGRAELRIDRPLPKKKAKPKAKAVVKKGPSKKPVKVKRLSRLEQLRKQHKERRESGEAKP